MTPRCFRPRLAEEFLCFLFLPPLFVCCFLRLSLRDGGFVFVLFGHKKFARVALCPKLNASIMLMIRASISLVGFPHPFFPLLSGALDQDIVLKDVNLGYFFFYLSSLSLSDLFILLTFISGVPAFTKRVLLQVHLSVCVSPKRSRSCYPYCPNSAGYSRFLSVRPVFFFLPLRSMVGEISVPTNPDSSQPPDSYCPSRELVAVGSPR